MVQIMVVVVCGDLFGVDGFCFCCGVVVGVVMVSEGYFVCLVKGCWVVVLVDDEDVLYVGICIEGDGFVISGGCVFVVFGYGEILVGVCVDVYCRIDQLEVSDGFYCMDIVCYVVEFEVVDEMVDGCVLQFENFINLIDGEFL